MALEQGSRLGPYVVLAPLGAGGMGEVFRARDVRLGREVALKVLSTRLASNPEALERFEREARAIAALSHPNILSIHDFGTQDGVCYAATELLRGETLRTRLERESLSWRKAVDIGAAIAEGLASAHAQKVIHRDLKPENVFLTDDGRAKILDFGLARLEVEPPSPGDSTVGMSGGLTEPGSILGTPGYMSPEQVRGFLVDARTDIFSFGAVLYEMLTGHRAFTGRTSADVMSAVLRDSPPDPIDSGKRIPVALWRVVMRCLEKSPEERFQSARDLTFALREIASGSGVEPPASEPVPDRTAKRAWLVPAALAAAALVVAMLVVLRLRPTGAAVRSLAVLPLANLSGDPTQDAFADGMTEELITSLARIGALQVTSRTSVMGYKGTTKKIPAIARELNVDAIVEGSVVRAGSRVKVTAQLIQAASDRHLWANSYERDVRDVLALQSDVAQAIARAVRVELSPKDARRLANARRVEPAAFEAYTRGRRLWSKRDKESLVKSLAEFQAAIDADPLYASAYAGLADAYAQLGYNSYAAPGDAFPKAEAAAARAIELDPASGEAHASLGYVKMYWDWDFPAAEREFQEAIRLAPSYAPGHQWYAYLLTCLERRMSEAVGQAQIAQRLDPLSSAAYSDLAFIQFYYGRTADAEKSIRSAFELTPEFPLGRFWLGRFRTVEKRYTDAEAELTKTASLMQWTPAMAARGVLYAAWGRPEEARKVLAEFDAKTAKGEYAAPYALAGIHVWLGEKDRAFELLEAAYKERSHWLLWLRRDPRWVPLRSDPRFADLTRRVGLPTGPP